MSFKELRNAIAKKFQKERKCRGLTQKELGAIVGLSDKTIGWIEAGKIENTTYATLEKLAKELGFELKTTIVRISRETC